MASPTSNDQRSDSKTPTSQEHKDALDNKANQGNPNNQADSDSRAAARQHKQDPRESDPLGADEPE